MSKRPELRIVPKPAPNKLTEWAEKQRKEQEEKVLYQFSAPTNERAFRERTTRRAIKETEHLLNGAPWHESTLRKQQREIYGYWSKRYSKPSGYKQS